MKDINIWPRLNCEVQQEPAIESRILDILQRMTLEQKIAQMIQPEIRDITVEDMREYGFGSYLNGGGAFPNNNKYSSPEDWIQLAEDMYQASLECHKDTVAIPTMWGTDAVHGHNNVMGATLFPHNIGLGATNNPKLLEEIAAATAVEVMATGIDWVFAPTVATARDDRWGRTYESYSEDPKIVGEYARAIVHGLQGKFGADFLDDKRVISTVKHFIGDGGTVGGDDQGDNTVSEIQLFEIHAQGYVGGLQAGAQAVMASFNSWHGEKIHGSKYLLTDVLKNQMGFDGLVVGDWNGHGQIEGYSNENCPQAALAGLDLYMVPTHAWKPLYENLIEQVKTGVISIERIDDAVSRILRVKLRAGLFEKPSPAKRHYSGNKELIGAASHRKIACQAVRESLVLLKNKQSILPLSPKLRILVAGDGADNIGKQAGGWSVTWQGTNNSNTDFPGGSSIYQGFREQIERAGGSAELSESGDYSQKPDIAVVVFGEDPYAEGHGDRAHLDYQRSTKHDLKLLKKLKSEGIPTVSIFISGRPMWVNAELNASDAFVAAWLPGSEGKAIADVLLRDVEGHIQHDFKGKLSFSWPNDPYDAVLNIRDECYQPLFEYGYGLNYASIDQLDDDLIETYQKPESETLGHKIYSGAPVSPWTFWLKSGEQIIPVTSGTGSFESVSFRTTDRFIQEDSFRITTNGFEPAGCLLVSQNFFREDISNEIIDGTVLSFSFKPLSKISGSVFLWMSCESEGDAPGSHSHGLDISKYMQRTETGMWDSISIDLSYFEEHGIDFTKVVIPFQITFESEVSIEINNIEFVKLKDDELPTVKNNA